MSPHAVETAAASGRFAICVHCGGGGIAARTIARDGTPHDLDAFRRVVELNLVGSFNMRAPRGVGDVEERTRRRR